MYWIPAIFIVIEIILISSLDNLIRYLNIQKIYQKYKDENLAKYIKSHFDSLKWFQVFIGFCFIGQLVYFVVGLFKPIWIISTIYILHFVISTIIEKVRKPAPIEKIIKRAKLKGFEASDVKLDRLLKLNELKGSEIKTYEWVNYIYPLIRIMTFILIIVLHYNFKIW